jgi:hypothetical protein
VVQVGGVPLLERRALRQLVLGEEPGDAGEHGERLKLGGDVGGATASWKRVPMC